MATTGKPGADMRVDRLDAATPSRRAISAEPPSSRRYLRTPLDSSGRRLGSSASGKKNNAPTPHARAAIRALDLRRAAVFTPGRNRRRSLREQRETPRDILRNLSRALAPRTELIPSSSSPGIAPPSASTRLDDDEDYDLPIDRPKLTLPIDIDDDSDLQPPRSSGLEDENYTMQSVEIPRRAVSEQPLSRLSRGSFGSIRVSDYFNVNDLRSDDIGDQSGFFPQGPLDDIGGFQEDLTYER
jgi:hypothetical protein